MTASTVFNARKDFLSVLDFDPADLDRCLNLSAQLKSDRLLGRRAPTANSLEGRHVAMLFEKASLRTRSTFEIATRELGGAVVPLEAEGHWASGNRSPTLPGTWSDGWTPS